MTDAKHSGNGPSDLLYTVENGIGRLTFNRPDQRNALTFAMYEQVAEICAGIPTDGSVKALILTGAGGRAFAAGTDMSQFRAFATPEDAWAYEADMDRVMSAIEACPLPTIAAIDGACTGGGAAIAACCDLRLATPSLKFGFPIARTLGNCLSISTLARLVALIGEARVREIVFTARLIEADEARAIALVSEVLPDRATLLAAAEGFAEKLGGHAPLTLRATKDALRRLRSAASTGVNDRDLIASCYMSDDFKEGIEAFLGKRKPNWTGR